MDARHIVNVLLDSFEDPKDFVTSRQNDWAKGLNHAAINQNVPGATRRKGRGYSDQWEVPYKDWLFVVSFYEDGTQIWSAHYKSHVYSWSSKTAKKRGFDWGGGGHPEKLPAGADPVAYLERLKKMADAHPAESIWRSRHIPYMPPAAGPDRWTANY